MNDFAILHNDDAGAFLLFKFDDFGVDGGECLVNFIEKFNLLFVIGHSIFLVSRICLNLPHGSFYFFFLGSSAGFT